MVRSSRGFTLMELIISSAISLFVMMGIFTMLISMQGGQDIFGQQNYLTSVTKTAFNRVLKDASEAVGSTDEPGILTVDTLGLVDPTFCIHKYQTEAPTDKWVCYAQEDTAVSVCDKDYSADDLPLRGADGVCRDGTALAVASVPAGAFTAANPDFTNDVFTVTITNRVYVDQPAGNNNPDYTVTGSVCPPGHTI